MDKMFYVRVDFYGLCECVCVCVCVCTFYFRNNCILANFGIGDRPSLLLTHLCSYNLNTQVKSAFVGVLQRMLL